MKLNIPKELFVPDMKPYIPGQDASLGNKRVRMPIPNVIPPIPALMLPIPDVIPPMLVCLEAEEKSQGL